MHGEEEKQVTPQMHCNTRLPLMFQTQLKRSPAEMVKEFISDIQLYREVVIMCVFLLQGWRVKPM